MFRTRAQTLRRSIASSSSSSKETDRAKHSVNIFARYYAKESIESIARRNGKFVFLEVFERLFEETDQGTNDSNEGNANEGKRRDQTKRTEYHVWHFLCAMTPLCISMMVVDYVRKNPHKNLVLRKENESRDERERVRRHTVEASKIEEKVLSVVRERLSAERKVEDEQRFSELIERVGMLEKRLVSSSGEKAKKKENE